MPRTAFTPALAQQDQPVPHIAQIDTQRPMEAAGGRGGRITTVLFLLLVAALGFIVFFASDGGQSDTPVSTVSSTIEAGVTDDLPQPNDP